MRHYEIMSQGALPYFVDIEHAPEQTMPLINRNFCKEVRELIDIKYNLWSNINLEILSEIKDIKKYEYLRNLVVSEAKELYNTEALAKYIIGITKNENR